VVHPALPQCVADAMLRLLKPRTKPALVLTRDSPLRLHEKGLTLNGLHLSLLCHLLTAVACMQWGKGSFAQNRILGECSETMRDL
jgi:hypothetical protein